MNFGGRGPVSEHRERGTDENNWKQRLTHFAERLLQYVNGVPSYIQQLSVIRLCQFICETFAFSTIK